MGKWVLADQSVFMLLFVRSIAALAILGYWLHVHGYSSLWRVDRPGLTGLRILAATAETTLFFIAVQYLSLAATLSIYLVAPLLVAVLAPWLLSERLTTTKIVGCLGGFVGVLLLLRPGSESFEPAAIIALFGMIALAATLMLARQLKTVEPMVLVTHQVLGTLMVGAVGLLFFQNDVEMPNTLDTVMMAGVGVSALVAQFFLIWSMRLAPASLVSPFFYSAMIWALLADALIWQVLPSPLSLAGALLIMASGIWLGRQRH